METIKKLESLHLFKLGFSSDNIDQLFITKDESICTQALSSTSLSLWHSLHYQDLWTWFTSCSLVINLIGKRFKLSFIFLLLSIYFISLSLNFTDFNDVKICKLPAENIRRAKGYYTPFVISCHKGQSKEYDESLTDNSFYLQLPL